MSKVVLKGYILVPNIDLEILKQELVTHIELTRQELGCLVFDISQDKSNASKFIVYEEFVDKYAFDKHQQRVKDSKWGNVTKSVERHYQVTYD